MQHPANCLSDGSSPHQNEFTTKANMGRDVMIDVTRATEAPTLYALIQKKSAMTSATRQKNIKNHSVGVMELALKPDTVPSLNTTRTNIITGITNGDTR